MFNKKLGYYTCNGVEFESKIRAMFHSVETKEKFDWVFNDAEFRNTDWSIEPIESLDELYDIRARELREKYDYLILNYSGGADSHNVLMSFIRQGLSFDELLINTAEKGWKDSTVIDPNNKAGSNFGAEHYLQVIPRLKELEPLMPNTKITIRDTSDSITDSFTDIGDASWIMDKKEALNPVSLYRFNYLYFDDVRSKFEKEKKIGLVFGVEKPRTFIKDGKFYTNFSDRAANMVNITNHVSDYDNTTVEYFYWSPDSIKIMIKQGHVIKQWLETNPQYKQYWDLKYITYSAFRLVHERVLRPIIYPGTWNNEWYQADKSTKDWYSEVDLWFINGLEGTNSKIIWDEGISYATEKLAQFLRLDPDTNKPDGFNVINRNYYIGDMSEKFLNDGL